MPDPSLVSLFVGPLNRADVEYMVTGGLAAVAYGHPRLTLDIDLVVRLSAADAARLATIWPAADFYVPPLEVMEEERKRPIHGHFNIIHTESAMRADIYVAGDDPMNAWALTHPVVREIEGEPVKFAPIEAVIIGKLRYFALGGSDRHLRDIARMLEISGDQVDSSELNHWLTQMQLQSEWTKAREYRDQE
jgi:hypothetical protein